MAPGFFVLAINSSHWPNRLTQRWKNTSAVS